MYSEGSLEEKPAIDLHRRNYYILLEKCDRYQVENEKLVSRLQHVKKLILKYKKQRGIIIKHLDEHGDKWREASYCLDLRTVNPPTDKLSEKTKSAKKKSERATRDPNAPKRPANPFFQFCQQERSSLLDAKRTELTKQEITKELAKKWSTLPQEERKIYYEKYEESRMKYRADIEEYKARGQISSSANVSPATPPSSSPRPTPASSPSPSISSSSADR